MWKFELHNFSDPHRLQKPNLKIFKTEHVYMTPVHLSPNLARMPPTATENSPTSPFTKLKKRNLKYSGTSYTGRPL